MKCRDFELAFDGSTAPSYRVTKKRLAVFKCYDYVIVI